MGSTSTTNAIVIVINMPENYQRGERVTSFCSKTSIQSPSLYVQARNKKALMIQEKECAEFAKQAQRFVRSLRSILCRRGFVASPLSLGARIGS